MEKRRDEKRREEKRRATNRWLQQKLLVVGSEPAALHHVWLLLIETQTVV